MFKFQPGYDINAYEKATTKAGKTIESKSNTNGSVISNAKTTTSNSGDFPTEVDDEFPPVEKLLKSPTNVPDLKEEQRMPEHPLLVQQPVQPRYGNSQDGKKIGDEPRVRNTETSAPPRNILAMQGCEVRDDSVRDKSDSFDPSPTLRSSHPVQLSDAAPSPPKEADLENDGPKTSEGLSFAASFYGHPRAASESTILGEHGRSESPVHQGKALYDDDDGDVPPGEWEADSIIGEKVINGQVHYVVAWKPTLEPEDNLGHMKELIGQWKGRVAMQSKKGRHDNENKKKRGAGKRQVGLDKVTSGISKRGRGQSRKV